MLQSFCPYCEINSVNYESQTKGGIFNARVIEEGDVQGTCKLPTSPHCSFSRWAVASGWRWCDRHIAPLPSWGSRTVGSLCAALARKPLGLFFFPSFGGVRLMPRPSLGKFTDQLPQMFLYLPLGSSFSFLQNQSNWQLVNSKTKKQTKL